MRVPLPRWLCAPAALGALLIVLPLVGLIARVDVAAFWGLITSQSALTALGLSLRTSLVATAICLLVGVPLAVVLARSRFPGQRLLRTLVLLPLVLPPVVGGIALLYTFGRMGFVGTYFEAAGIRIAFTSAAVVLAQSFVSLPFMVMTVEGALASQDERYEVVGLGLGASPGYVLRRITLPLLRPALVSGTVLSFARALGEFGATITFAGSLEGTTRTLPLEIYLQRETDPDAAVALSLVLVVIAVVIVLATYGAQGASAGGALRRLRAFRRGHGERTGRGERGAHGGHTPLGDAPERHRGDAVAVSPSGQPPAAEAPAGPAAPAPPVAAEGTRGAPAGAASESPAGPGLRVAFACPVRGITADFAVAAGSTTAIIGPNGAGKSTCCEVISGLLRPAAVLVELDGRVLAREHRRRGHAPTAEPGGTGGAGVDEIRAAIAGAGSGRAWVPSHRRGVVQLAQSPLLFPTLRVEENAAFGLRAAGEGRAAARSRARVMLERVGALPLADRLPSELSGGQAQRAAIARALAARPQLLLLDEPMAALDWDSARAIRELLGGVLAAQTALLITHDVRDVRALADHVIVLEDGGVLQSGTVAEVFAAPASPFVARFAAQG
ncbi:molybdate ABC transporter permease subunit [Brevibacterium sp. 5221]|uniref:Molybdate ABC transporter permease subunit n=1 Tax=Brevibacterium rongguiense TaxID=2695267 RepID=A0A6N9H7G7_9MICO|nr:ABC transporter permease [Brevibacterium rongguiense]MYM19716.1 molybdate ABC transporter permease subunit [Brevibacterium rongguiense]